MPKDKKKRPQPSTQHSQQRGLKGADSFFETAEEIANRHPESKERGKDGKQHKTPTAKPKPENPELQG